MKQRKIKKILLDGRGWIYSEDGEIERFEKNGEMAYVEWFRQRNREFNGKYVCEVVFEEEYEKRKE